MAKGIIVVEIPGKCEDCPFTKYITMGDSFCGVTGKYMRGWNDCVDYLEGGKED